MSEKQIEEIRVVRGDLPKLLKNGVLIKTRTSLAMTLISMQMRKWLIALLGAGALVAMVLLIFKARQPPASPVLPSPNGYDDFVKAGKMLAVNGSDFFEMNDAELCKLVNQNAEALRLARLGLGRECRVPLVYSQAYMQSHLSELALMKSLTQAFRAEGRLAEMEHRHRDAARAYLDCMRLGHEASRGGPLIDGLVRVACEAIGSTGLESVVTNLNAGECLEVIAALDTIAQKQESFEEVLKNEADWSRRSFSFYQSMISSFMQFFNIGSYQKAVQKAAQKFQSQDRRRLALEIEVASRAYSLDEGIPPQSISDLVPDYLKSIPRDPLTGTNFQSLKAN